MSGVPVLTSDLKAIVEVVKTHDVGQVLPSLAPADIGAAINAMLADTKALSRMRHNAHSAACECCWEKEQEKLVRFYHRILQADLQLDQE